MENYKILGTPFKIGNVEIPNRFVMLPMTALTGPEVCGLYNDLFTKLYVERAKGGFGLIVTGALAVDYKVDGAYFSPLKNPEQFVESGKKFTQAIHNEGSKVFTQITAGVGRNGKNAKTPSPLLQYGTKDVITTPLTVEEIKLKIEQVIEASKLVKEAGFDGIELHAMHWGYLLDQMTMSFFNHREDEYGGSLENRMRMVKELVEGIHDACGKDYPVGMRLGLKSFMKGYYQASFDGKEEVGRTLEEAIEICKMLEEYGIDYVNVDTGTYDSFYYACPPSYLKMGFMNDLAKKAKEVLNIPVIAGSRMQNPDLSVKGIETNCFDAIGLGRPSLADPAIANKMIHGEINEIRPCLGCNEGCLSRIFTGKPVCCAVNPQAAREEAYAIKVDSDNKNVTVIGGGVAGMEAARVSALRGYKTTLIEKDDHLGGHLVEAGGHEFKQEIAQLNEYYKHQLNKLGVTVLLNTEANKEVVLSINPDKIILATGSKSSVLPIEGIEKALDSLDAINHPEKIGQKVVVIGGGLTGCEIAYDEAQKGKDVTLVEGMTQIMSNGAAMMNTQMLKDGLAYYNVKVLTSHMLEKVTDTGVVLKHDDEEVTLEADTVITALGFKPVSIKEQIEGLGIPVYEAGDNVSPKMNIMNAIWRAFDVANDME